MTAERSDRRRHSHGFVRGIPRELRPGTQQRPLVRIAAELIDQFARCRARRVQARNDIVPHCVRQQFGWKVSTPDDIQQPVSPAARLCRFGCLALRETPRLHEYLERRLSPLVLHTVEVECRACPAQHIFPPLVSKTDQVAHDREGQMGGELAHGVEAVSLDQLLDQLLRSVLDHAADVLKSGGKKWLRGCATDQAMTLTIGGGRVSPDNFIRECTSRDALAADESIMIAEGLGEHGVMDQSIVFMPRKPHHRSQISHRSIMRPRILDRLIGEDVDVVDRCTSHKIHSAHFAGANWHCPYLASPTYGPASLTGGFQSVPGNSQIEKHCQRAWRDLRPAALGSRAYRQCCGLPASR